MKTCMILLTVAGCSSLPSLAGPLTKNERDRALSELHASRKQFLDVIEGLSPAQWNFKPDAASWSVAECAEHIALSEDVLFGVLKNKIMKSPAAPEKSAMVKGKDEEVLRIINDRSGKAQAPESIRPAHRWANRQELAEHFRESRSRTLDYVRETQDDLRSHLGYHPAVKDLDGYQWLLLIAAHTERHVQQIDEVKRHPGFPRQ